MGPKRKRGNNQPPAQRQRSASTAASVDVNQLSASITATVIENLQKSGLLPVVPSLTASSSISQDHLKALSPIQSTAVSNSSSQSVTANSVLNSPITSVPNVRGNTLDSNFYTGTARGSTVQIDLTSSG